MINTNYTYSFSCPSAKYWFYQGQIFVLGLFIFAEFGSAQTNTLSVDPNLIKVPASVSKSPVKLAKLLTENVASEKQQVLNIYTWVIHNIKYDIKALRKIDPKSYSPEQTLRRKKGICYQYSELFALLCQKAGLSCREIHGYSRGLSFHEDDRFYESDHSWNGVKIGEAWYLLDATWGSGFVQQKKRPFRDLLYRWFKKPYINQRLKFILRPNYEFFLASPASFIQHHLPADPHWQLLEFPVSVSTFEANHWKSYAPRIDSSYQRQVDSLEYLKRLNKYEFLTDQQYFLYTADQSHDFNPRNSRLIGLASLIRGRGLEQSRGNPERILKAHQEASQLYRLSIEQLRNHRKSVSKESSITRKTTKTRISKELKSPLRRRISKCKGHQKNALKFIETVDDRQERYQNQISMLYNRLAKGFRSFNRPKPSGSEQMELFQENKAKLDSLSERVANHQDSSSRLAQQLDSLIKVKHQLQRDIVKNYPQLPSLLMQNQQAIRQKHSLSRISSPLQIFDSIGSDIDRLYAQTRSLDRIIKQVKIQIWQQLSSISSLSSGIQVLVIQNCYFSNNKTCEENLYRASNECLRSIQKTKIRIEKSLMKMTRQDAQFYQELEALSGDLLKIMDTCLDFIALYEERRLAGIEFKKAKSYDETNQWINDARNSLERIKLYDQHLKNGEKGIKP